MLFPKQRIRFATSYEGHPSRSGYLLLDLKGLDLEGVTTLVLEIDDAEAARAAGDRQDEAKRKLQDLLGG